MGGNVGRSSSSSSSSSGEEDGDAEWRAAIDSVANGPSTTSNGSATKSIRHTTENDETDNHKPPNLKHYHIKAQKLLDDILEKTIQIVKDPIHVLDNDTLMNDCGVRLFTDAPLGIVFDHRDELQGPIKRPRLLPGKEIDEKSKMFKRQLQSVAVDGTEILAAASDNRKKTLAKREAKEAAAKAAAKREEERVAELKRIRGERWLPSVARAMQITKGRR